MQYALVAAAACDDVHVVSELLALGVDIYGSFSLFGHAITAAATAFGNADTVFYLWYGSK